MGEIIKNTRPDFQVLAGSAGFLYPSLVLGAVAVSWPWPTSRRSSAATSWPLPRRGSTRRRDSSNFA